MKNLIIALATVFAFSTSYSFAASSHEKGNNASAKSEHEMTVGNAKAASEGSTADDKTVKAAKATNTHKQHNNTQKKPK